VNEEERAKRLSDAIDAMLQGDQAELDLDDDELIELLRIARLRHEVGQARADIASASRELVWRVLKARGLGRKME
jgi:hypothetical protein